MADRPILFSGPMVRALLAGRKTQTRRILKPQPVMNLSVGAYVCSTPIAPGDRLWCREAFSGPYRLSKTPPRMWADERMFNEVPIWFWADSNPEDGDWTKPKPGMFMPRWASRLTLTVTDVRVQRLHDMEPEDAIAEGIRRSPHGNQDQWIDYPEGSSAAGWVDPRSSFDSLWRSINGADSWEGNTWVAAYSFTVEQRNIDAARVPEQGLLVTGGEK